jgi:hypothetical protein
MDDTTLFRFRSPISAELRERLIEQSETPHSYQERVQRTDGSTIDLTVTDDLMTSMTLRFDDAGWADDSAASDRWLAPRLHYALRLSRAEAGDRQLWAWLATRYTAYIRWRWTGKESVNEARWSGPVHKQALMRLWWGAELFRNGSDYTPVTRAFVRQDLPNSYLHRPLVRCRSLALAVVDVLAPANGGRVRTAGEVNDLARVLNLAMAGSPPELETDFQQDDHKAYGSWLHERPTLPTDWDKMPTGPVAQDTTMMSLAGGRAIAERGWGFAADGRNKKAA